MARPAYRLEPRGKKGILWVRFTTPNGREIFKSSRTTDRAFASEWASKLHAQAYRQDRLGEKPRRRWAEAMTRWVEAHQHKRSLKKDQHNLHWLHPWLGDKYLDEINSELLADIAAARRAQPRDKAREGRKTNPDGPRTSQATADKMLALVRSILRAAASWGWLDSVPAIKLAPPPSDEDYRWLTRDDAAKLHDALADHLRPMYLLSLSTGLREQNVLRLEWTRVDLARKSLRITAAAAKGKRAIGVPLNRDALAILQAQQGQHVKWVFPGDGPKGEPFTRANNHGFKAAQIRAGIAPLRWHDLRHTWASWHVMAGTSLRSLMELGGWRSYKSVLRYAHLSPDHLAADAARLEGLARDLHGYKKGNRSQTAANGLNRKPAKRGKA